MKFRSKCAIHFLNKDDRDQWSTVISLSLENPLCISRHLSDFFLKLRNSEIMHPCILNLDSGQASDVTDAFYCFLLVHHPDCDLSMLSVRYSSYSRIEERISEAEWLFVVFCSSDKPPAVRIYREPWPTDNVDLEEEFRKKRQGFGYALFLAKDKDLPGWRFVDCQTNMINRKLRNLWKSTGSAHNASPAAAAPNKS